LFAIADHAAVPTINISKTTEKPNILELIERKIFAMLSDALVKAPRQVVVTTDYTF
jgi:hypothetical protein